MGHYLARPDTTVIASVRDTTSAKAKELELLQKGEGSRIIIVELAAEDPYSAVKAATKIHTQHQIDHVDIAVANAGHLQPLGPNCGSD